MKFPTQRLPPITSAVCCALLFSLGVSLVNAQNFPNPEQFRKLAIESLRKSEQDLEKYSCMVHEETDELNSDGSVKKRRYRDFERFYVNGVPVDHNFVIDGVELKGDRKKREQERADYETRKYSNLKEAEKMRNKQEVQVIRFLQAVKFINPRREIRNGRSTLVYDLAGDPKFRPKTLEDRFMQALTGRIWVDEESAMPVEIRAETAKDVKIGGGIIASLHKGFRIHVLQARQSDGVWLRKKIEGTGDARAMFFMHPRFQYREDTGQCSIFSVDTNQNVHSAPGVRP